MGSGRLHTLRGQEVGEQHQARDEHAGHDDVNNVEEWLPANNERVDDVSFPWATRRVTSWRRITPGQKSMAHSPFSAGREARSVSSRGMWRPALLSVPTSDSVWGGVGACNSRRGEDESHLGQGRWAGNWVRKGRSQGAYGTTTREEGVLGRQSRMISGKVQVKARLSVSPSIEGPGQPHCASPLSGSV